MAGVQSLSVAATFPPFSSTRVLLVIVKGIAVPGLLFTIDLLQ
uniref:Uncharacterized protein n=1 Tax=Bacteroides fragilis TaxID=817 RepID=A0A1J0AJH8_BACFG|nr:hypothetical protein [Bacteroides fragilis]